MKIMIFFHGRLMKITIFKERLKKIVTFFIAMHLLKRTSITLTLNLHLHTYIFLYKLIIIKRNPCFYEKVTCLHKRNWKRQNTNNGILRFYFVQKNKALKFFSKRNFWKLQTENFSTGIKNMCNRYITCL